MSERFSWPNVAHLQIRVGCLDCGESTQLFCSLCDEVVDAWSSTSRLELDIEVASILSGILTHRAIKHGDRVVAPDAEEVAG